MGDRRNERLGEHRKFFPSGRLRGGRGAASSRVPCPAFDFLT
jgi:hypothetical protein